MRSRDRYTFNLEVIYPDDTSTTRWIHPQYDGLTLEYNRENEQKFYRRQLSNDLVLIGDEAREFINESIYNRYRVTIYDRGNKVVRCAFRRTDCEIDKDHWTVKIDPNNDDEYKQLDGTDKEFNLVKLAPAMKTLSMTVRPIIQTYCINQPHYSTYGYFGLLDKECSVYETYKDLFTATYYFGCPVCYIHVNLTHQTQTRGYHGLFLNTSRFTGEGSISSSTNPLHGNVKLTPDNGVGFAGFNVWWVSAEQRISTNTDKDEHTVEVTERDAIIVEHTNGTAYFYPDISTDDVDVIEAWSTGTVDGTNYGYDVMPERIARIPKLEGKLKKVAHNSGSYTQSYWDKWSVTLDCYKTSILRSCHGLEKKRTNGDRLLEKLDAFISLYTYKFYNDFNSVADVVTFSLRTTPEPQQYGTVEDTDNAQYWLPPTNEKDWLPIFQELWNEHTGAMFTKANTLLQYCFEYQPEDYSQVVTLKDWYSLGSSIKVLLKQIAPDILFEEMPEYSQFLFADNNPITNQKQGRYYILQKSNAINLHYDLAAWKGMITLDKVFEMLKNALNCYYHIDEDNKLHIEHAYYYDNGMTYAQGQDRNLLNLNDWYDGKNRLQLSFRTNRWKYNTEQQADRYEYSWMDGQSEPFEGKPILITDAYNLFKKHQTEKRQISWFSSDIDYLFAFGEDFSKDGFLLVQTEPGSNKVPIGNLTFDGYTRSLQNVYCAMAWLQPAFHLYDLYAAYVECNGELMLVKDRKPIRSQDLTFNIPDSVSFSPQYLVQSLADIGRVETLKIDLTDDKAEATVELPADE